MLLWWCALIFVADAVLAAPLDLHLRVSWGNGDRRLWRGAISISEGTLERPRCLGIEADAADRMELADGVLRFAQRTPMSLDGFDFHVIAPETAVLTVELIPNDQPAAVKKVDVKLVDFVPGTAVVHDSLLDDRRNRLLMQRVPADWIRLQLAKDSLVFSPGEEFSLEVLPTALGLADGSPLRCVLQLVSTADDRSLWTRQHELHVDASGNTEPVQTSLLLPEEEGVYELSIGLHQRRFGDAIVQGKPLFHRNVQLIVIGNDPEPPESTAWQLVDEIDSADPKWWERYLLIPRKLPVITPKGPLGDKPLRAVKHGVGLVHEIGPSGWHAAPIPIEQIGAPHLLEIEYPRGTRQTIGISVLETDAAGEIGAKGLDSGVDVPASVSDQEPVMEKHRLVFWPRTKNPWLLVTNRRNDLPVLLGKMRVYAGPQQLPKASIPPRRAGQRLVAAYLDKPLFAENFGAPESLDATTNRSLRDWHTFYWGVVRLAEYLHYAGYNAAFVPVATDGTTLYPTQLLDVIPKWENGVFFSNGQDPVSKDVLDLLLRVFDRQGLTLIPVVQFATPLPDLEALVRGDKSAMHGVTLVGMYPQETSPILGARESHRGLAPYYNPLDPRVQQAMRRVTTELLERCSGHPSFGGLALQLNPHGYAQLPDENWALDDMTFRRFAADLKLEVPAEGQNPVASRLAMIRGEMRVPWLKWRAAKLGEFYESLRSDVAESKRDATFYLDMHELISGRVIQTSMRPRLPARDDIHTAMLRHGVDVEYWQKRPGVIVLRPNRIAPTTSLPASATNIELTQSAAVEDYFRSFHGSGTLLYHELQTLRVPGFDQVSPFGPENTYTWLAAHISPSGLHARKVLIQNLVSLDATVIAAGGWMAPLGQEESLRPIYSILGQLPAEPFHSIPSRTADATDMAVRVLQRSDATYIYVANATGLRSSVRLKFQNAMAATQLEMLSDRQPPQRTAVTDGAISVRLEAYDLACFVAPAGQGEVVDWEIEFDPQDVAVVRSLVQEFRARVDGLRNRRAIEILTNPSFEKPLIDGQIPGWRLTGSPAASATTDNTAARTGAMSLRLRVDQPNVAGKLRSDPFPLPKSGRISLLARLRTPVASRQPPLRMAIEGRQANGTPIYLWSQPLGVAVDSRLRPTGAPALVLPTQWNDPTSEFLFHVVDLPAGGAGEISVGFDLLGPGEVSIDDVEVFDLYFPDVERNELVKNVGSIQLQLQEGQYATCHRFLQGYWPRYVLEFAPIPPTVPNVPSSPTARISQLPDSGSKKESTPAADRAKPVEKKAPWYKLPRSPIKIPFL